jgi:hypothetical protein
MQYFNNNFLLAATFTEWHNFQSSITELNPVLWIRIRIHMDPN